MDPNEIEESFVEDQQVEITDLPGWPQSTTPSRTRWRRVTTLLLRQRRIRLVALLLLGTLCLAFLWRAAGTQFSLLSALFEPNPANDVPGLSIDQFYFNLGPDWARLTIDGRPITNPPQVGRGKPLLLEPGMHQFRWQAAPFPNHSCSITVPSRLTDTCTIQETTSTPDGQRAWIVMFNTSLLTLAPEQRSDLTTAITQALKQFQPGEMVYPGEHFIDTLNHSGPVTRADQELNATLNLTLDDSLENDNSLCTGGDTNTGLCQLDGQDCSMLCTQPGNGSNAWRVVALVQSSWTYTAPDGQVVAAHMPDEQGGAAFLKHFLPLSIFWNRGSWSVLPGQEFLYNASLMPLSCASAADNNAISTLFGNSPWEAFSWHYIPASNPAAGCLLVLTAIANNGPSATTSAQIIYLHRFGVSLAVNHLAQEYDPEMPHPDTYEMDVARQIAAQAEQSL